jgi:hypothetical protein
MVIDPAGDSRAVSSAEDLFRRMRDAIERAGELCVRRLSVAGRIVELASPGERYLDEIFPAQAHLESKSTAAADLRIYVVDYASNGIAGPEAPWVLKVPASRGEIRGASADGRWHAAYSVGRSTLYLYDAHERVGICWTQDAAALPGYDRASPMFFLWHWWLKAIGMGMVHGAALGFEDGGVLLAARSGSGKSTTALACLRSPLRYAGDDYCVAESGVEPRIHSMYCTAKVLPDNLQRLPHMAAAVEPSSVGAEKLIFNVRAHWPKKIITGFPLRAVVVPRVSGLPETRFERIAPSAALRALAPSTLFVLNGAGAGAEEFRRMGDLVRCVPSYMLHLGTNLDEIPRAIAAILQELRA